MAITDMIKKVPADPGLSLMIEIKYGKPSASRNYIDGLPLTVVKETIKKLWPFPSDAKLDSQPEIVLRDKLELLLCTEEGLRVVSSTLFIYHKLLGRV